jgi:hypothetical protein
MASTLTDYCGQKNVDWEACVILVCFPPTLVYCDADHYSSLEHLPLAIGGYVMSTTRDCRGGNTR